MNVMWLYAFGALAALLLFLGGYTAFFRGPTSDLLLALCFTVPGLLIAVAIALDATGVIS